MWMKRQVLFWSNDIVNLDRDMQDELRESIEKEGRILYEKI